MTTFRFIHTSDLQLGMTRKFLRPEAQSRFDDARLRAVEKLGALALSNEASCIVVAGDVFEHNALERRTLMRALEALKSLPVPVFLLPGNHDPLVADSIFAHTEGIENITVLDSFAPVEVAPGVDLVGAPLTAKYASEDLCARAVRDLEPTERVRVLVGHGAVAGFGADDTDAVIDVAALDARIGEGVIDYVALGDTHSTTSLGATGRVWYSGSPETTDYHDFGPDSSTGKEVDSGNALVVTIKKTNPEDAEVEVRKEAVGAWTFDALHWEVADLEDVQALLQQLEAYPHKDRTVIKYSIAGTLGLEATGVLERGLGALEPVFAALYERTRLMNLHLAPDDEELERLPLTGYARETMHELVEAAARPGSSEGQSTARDAVNLLFRLSKEVN